MAAGAGRHDHVRDMGTDLMISGIVWQVATLIVFAGLVIDYVIRTWEARDHVPECAKTLAGKTSFRLFVGGVAVAFVAIFSRCVYRIAEMVGGWANPIMRNEAGFVVMEGLYVFPSHQLAPGTEAHIW